MKDADTIKEILTAPAPKEDLGEQVAWLIHDLETLRGKIEKEHGLEETASIYVEGDHDFEPSLERQPFLSFRMNMAILNLKDLLDDLCK